MINLLLGGTPFVRVLKVGLMLLVLAAATWGVYRSTFGYWDRMKYVASRIETPTGIERLYETRQGDVICIITCERGAASLSVWYRTSLSYEEACESFRKAIGERFGPVTSEEPGGYEGSRSCDYRVGLPSVKSDARLGVTYYTPSAFYQCLERHDCVRGPHAGTLFASRDQALVSIGINSGIE